MATSTRRPGRRRATALAVALGLAALSAACGGGDAGASADAGAEAGTGTTSTEAAGGAGTSASAEGDQQEDDVEELFPDVLEATARQDADGTWTFSATLSSPYDSPERYADAWRVVGPGGEVYGIRELTHDHASEQPFTRSQSGIEIPDGVDRVTVEGRDQVSGWGGATVEVPLP